MKTNQDIVIERQTAMQLLYVVGGFILLIVVVGLILVIPDFIRYWRIKSM